METRFEFGDTFGAVLSIALFTGFAAKLMAKVPSANQAKGPAAMITPCLHGATAFVAVPSMIKVALVASGTDAEYSSFVH